MVNTLELQAAPNTIGRLFIDSMMGLDDSPVLKAFDGRVQRDISRRKLYQAVIMTAKGLLSLGIQPGDRVVILSEDNIAFICLDLAILLIGAVSVTPFPTNSADQVRYVVDETQAKAMFVEDDQQLKKVLSVHSQIPFVTNIFVMHQLDSLWKRGSSTPDADLRQRVLQVAPADIASIIYTSGTTGRSKGVVHSHFNHAAHVVVASEMMQVADRDVYLSYFPLSHIGGRISLYVGLIKHSVFAIPRGRYMDSVVEDLKQINPTIVLAVPSLILRIQAHIRSMIADTGIDPDNIPQMTSMISDFFGGRLRYIQEGGAPLDEDLIRFFDRYDVRILEVYGSAETSAITFNTITDRKIGTVGKPYRATEVAIDHSNSEILVRGDTVMQGYWNKPDLTQTVFDNGWFHTGDIGATDADGFLRITGRIKNLIITAGGSNVPRQPIEEALLRYRYFHQAHVVGEGKKFLAALIVPDNDQLEEYARTHGIDDPEDLLDQPLIRGLLWKGVEEVNEHLDKFEQIHKIAVIRSPFTIESGQLGVLGKNNSTIIEDTHARIIDSLYDAASRDAQIVLETLLDQEDTYNVTQCAL